jgi:geranylgeranyl diphosphate synthase type 3
MESFLLEPVEYYKQQKGKNIRKLLSDFFGKLLGLSNENIELINTITNNVHNASLVIDDIQDNGVLRRNEPCAHLKYGVPLSLNAGYYAIFKSLSTISHQFSSTCKNKVIEYITIIHEGQGMDIYYTHHKIIPSIEEYEKMMMYKTGYAFIINLEMLLDKSINVVFKKKQEQFKNTLLLFSLFFQIRDDYINLTDPEYWKIKGFCQDFDEEKISYLITYFHNNNILHNKPNPNIIKMMKDKSIEGKLKIITIFYKSGLFDIMYTKLLELKQTILNEMNIQFIFDQLPVHPFNIHDIVLKKIEMISNN